MVQRRPESADATMTMTKPAKLKSVSPATSSPSPQLMMNTTAARFQLGLQARQCCSEPCMALGTTQQMAKGNLYASSSCKGCLCPPFNAPQETEPQQEDRRGRLAHCVERERDEG